MNPLYVGIDVSSKTNVVYLMKPDGSKISNFSVDNSLDKVIIGLEATSIYGDNLVYFLREDCSLSKHLTKIHILNPKQVKKIQRRLQ